ncbi:hypothetical protein TSUD_236790 [Trifolium subterraneum]|uniref:Reverse transcriptase zinc-binding domain-containing protein n=1 Tax=Trifolium subterraneum TaxID=3900 RepID=A0A2Z6P0N8_TRISU|nr:hypothetical protein TSUD_236790 [Trifolium subterraneum]
MLVDREGLWFRVLAARYGMERGRLRDGGRRGSAWWREIVRIREGGELGGSWFGEHVSKRVGDRSDTFFWTDPWVEGIPLSERFGRLFDLAGNKLRTVAEMFSLGWGVDGGAWEWRRQLWAGTDPEILISGSGQWQPDPVEGYTVQRAYKLLTSQASATMDDLTFALLAVGWLSRLTTYSSLAVLLDPFGLHMFSRWISGVTLLFAAHLASMCVGCVDGEKSPFISRLNKQLPTVVGQDQAFLL